MNHCSMQCNGRCLRMGMRGGKYYKGEVRCTNCERWFKSYVVNPGNDGYTIRCVCCNRILKSRPKTPEARKKLMKTVHWSRHITSVNQVKMT